MLQLNNGGAIKIKSIRKATETEHRPPAAACGTSSDGPDKPPC